MNTPQFMERNGAGLRYRLEGEGPVPVVLIHEMGGALESWDLFVPLIAPACRVLRLDMRGFGMASKVRGTHDLDTIVDDLSFLLEALGLNAPVHVAGMAVGGAAALRFASRHPHRVASLAAISPALGVAAERRSGLLARADAIETGGMAAISVEELGMTYPENLRNPGAFAAYRARWLGNDAASYAATCRMLAALDLRADVAALACPTLFMAGTFDPLRPPSLIKPLAQGVANAGFSALASGHVAAWQTPAALANALLPFWQHGTFPSDGDTIR